MQGTFPKVAVLDEWVVKLPQQVDLSKRTIQEKNETQITS